MLQAQIAAAKSKEKVIMAHIDLADGVPGIRGPMLLSPETTKPLRELVEVLLKMTAITASILTVLRPPSISAETTN